MFESADYIPLIIPTVLIPLTLISVGISVVATFIAGLFGIELKAEGPKQLLEVLLKPKFIITALVLNLTGFAGYKAYVYFDHHSAFSWTIARKHEAKPLVGKSYSDFKQIPNHAQKLGSLEEAVTGVEVVWQQKVGKGSFRSSALSGDSVFFGSRDGYAYEVNVQDGEILRKFFVGTTVSPTPIIENEHLYLGEGTHHTHHARIYKIDLQSGEHIASYQTKGHTESSPVIGSYQGKKLMFFSAGSDGIHAVDPKTMELVWKHRPGHIDASMVHENDQVFASTGREKNNLDKSKLYALSYDFLTGKEIWRQEIPLSGWMKPALSGNSVCYALGEIYFKSDQGALSCFDKKTGQPQFSIINDAPLMGVPFVLNNDIIFTDLKGKICRVNIGERRRVWCYETQAEGKQMISVSYSKDQGLLALTTSKNGIYFLRPNDGKMVFHYMPEGEWGKVYASPRAVPGGWVIVDMKGNAKKIKLLKASSQSSKPKRKSKEKADIRS